MVSTWILLVIVYSATTSASAPVGITSVLGYTSQIDCQTAQNEVMKQFTDPLQIQASCIPGSWSEAKPH